MECLRYPSTQRSFCQKHAKQRYQKKCTQTCVDGWGPVDGVYTLMIQTLTKPATRWSTIGLLFPGLHVGEKVVYCVPSWKGNSSLYTPDCEKIFSRNRRRLFMRGCDTRKSGQVKTWLTWLVTTGLTLHVQNVDNLSWTVRFGDSTWSFLDVYA